MPEFNEVAIIGVPEENDLRPPSENATYRHPSIYKVCLEEEVKTSITKYVEGGAEGVEFYTIPVTHRPVKVVVG
jgi:hypothetical protein